MSNAPYENLKLRRQRAMEEAAAWLIRLREDPPNSAARTAYADWLLESPLHVAAMLRISHTESALAAFDGWDQIPTTEGPHNDTVVEWPPSLEVQGGNPEPGRVLAMKRVALVAAAALIMIAMGGVLWWSGLVGGTVYQTTIGERRDVALQDGSRLVLGPETRVRVAFAATDRYVTLERGEALFKVAKDPGRPFVVAADRALVRVLGTEFGVERQDSTVVVTVAEGRVAVSQTSPSISVFAERSARLSPVALTAGEQVSIPRVGVSSPVRKVDTADSLAWAHGRLVFNDATVAFIVERFNQYNRVQLVITDPRIAERRISGSFDASDPQSFLTFLRASMPLTVSRAREGSEILLRAGPAP